MNVERRVNASVNRYLEGLAARVVARSGRPEDRHHLGKLIFQALREAPSEDVSQIDGGTGEAESFGSVLDRSVRCARALAASGLRTGDVIVLIAPNHINVCIPLYAALYQGITVAPIDKTLKSKELQETLEMLSPKMILCESEKASDVNNALTSLGLDATIVTFNAGVGQHVNFQQFLEEYANDKPGEKIENLDFDPEETLALLVATSGTTGVSKYVTLSHFNLVMSIRNFWCRHWQFPRPTQLQLVVGPVEWISANYVFIASAIYQFSRLQSSKTFTVEHVAHLFKTYKPSCAVLTPMMVENLMEISEPPNLSCLDYLMMGGITIPQKLIDRIRDIFSGSEKVKEVLNCWGLSEVAGPGLMLDQYPPPPNSCGRPLPDFQYRLVDIDTQKDITEPYVNGELWLKGPEMCKGYYKNPSATKELFSADGWLKSGDLFYRDEHWNFYFVDKIKLLIRCMASTFSLSVPESGVLGAIYTISPLEVESVIASHPAVSAAAVTSVYSSLHGEQTVACVVRSKGTHVSAEAIKDLVLDKLGEKKQLRGGVVFLDALPLTANGKIHRQALKKLAATQERL